MAKQRLHKNLYPTLLTWYEPTKCLRRVFYKGVTKSWSKVTCKSCLGSQPKQRRIRIAHMNQAELDLPPVLDACCGPRQFWFDRADPRALFIDKRCETHPAAIGTPKAGIIVAPDQVVDFTEMPFPDESFQLVVFDPPHVQRAEAKGTVTRKYGVLSGDWREMLSKGFAECFRVLKPNGVLVFKWAESQFKVKDILKLTPEKPLFGHHTSKTTHWAVFMKQRGDIGESNG